MAVCDGRKGGEEGSLASIQTVCYQTRVPSMMKLHMQGADVLRDYKKLSTSSMMTMVRRCEWGVKAASVVWREWLGENKVVAKLCARFGEDGSRHKLEEKGPNLCKLER